MKDRVYKIRLKKGDTVMIRSGKHKGRTGKVLAVHPQLNKVTVEGINVVKRHYKPTQTRPQGGVQELTKPIWVSKVGLLDSTAKKPSRIGYKVDAQGAKKRYLKTSGKEVK
ncbi:MAG TPA: 50S ribosomal protein L24 [Candidatus Saccharimonadales bacterium]|nr:50S ribosomal protein L24 [Candidatus Saccharimonadales bacterium]